MKDIPGRRWPSGMTSLNPACRKPPFTLLHPLWKPYGYSVSSSTITCLSIANRSRAANPNRQSSKSASINTSLLLSQLQAISKGTYVATLQHAPRGYANDQDLLHDLAQFLSCKPRSCDKPCKKKPRHIWSARSASETPLLWRGYQMVFSYFHNAEKEWNSYLTTATQLKQP